MQRFLHLVGCNLELYYDARTYEYQILYRFLYLSGIAWKVCIVLIIFVIYDSQTIFVVHSV